uniref:E3 UFM1-protein ligase 1 homolog n=1 Tax=Lygus hesperus TaxID=30085 RepID=A0A0K8SRL7_LYGHE
MAGASWEEVKRLAADFQRAQLTTSSQTLSERNCIEVLTKLVQSNFLDVVFTTDGKECITPQYLVKEIKDELYVNGGRVNLVELSKNLKVDLSHISSRIPEVERTEAGCIVVLGQLINRTYQLSIAEEINDSLQRLGQISVADLTKLYDLPGDFLLSVVEKNLGKIIHGKQDKSDSRVFYTEAFVEKNRCILRGTLRALTQPVQVNVLLNLTQLKERDLFFAFDSLMETKDTCGQLTGRQANSLFIPQIYTKQQTEWVENFYKQNGYLEFDALTRLGISDPVSFVNRHFDTGSMLELPSCIMGPQLISQVDAAVQETLLTGSFLDVSMLLPSIFGPSDISTVLEEVLKKTKSKSTPHIFCDSVLITDAYLQELTKPYHSGGILKKKAEKAVSSGAFIQAQYDKKGKSITKEDFDSKTDKRDERRKKATGGKAGGGAQGRETKTKSTKKKHMVGKGRGDQADSDSDDESMKKPIQQGKLELITLKEIEKELTQSDGFQDLVDIEGLAAEVARHLYPLLNKQGMELAAEAFERTLVSSAGDRRKAHGNLQEQVDNWVMELRLADRGIKQFPNEDSRTRLTQYLLKSTGADLVNALVAYAGEDPANPSAKNLSPQDRAKILTQLDGDAKDTLTALNKTLATGSVEDFLAAVEPALAAVGLLNRKADKKKERQFMLNKRELLLTEVGRCDNPALLLHAGVLLIFQTATQTILNASGKFVPSVLTFLRPHLSNSLHDLLHKFQDLVLKLLTVGDDAEAENKYKSELNEMMPLVKEEISNYRKTNSEKNADK